MIEGRLTKQGCKNGSWQAATQADGTAFAHLRGPPGWRASLKAGLPWGECCLGRGHYIVDMLLRVAVVQFERDRVTASCRIIGAELGN